MQNELPPVGILSTGTYLPQPRMGSREIAQRTGIPLDVIERKFGILSKPVPGPDDHPCAMGARAADVALRKAGVDPLEVDAVLSISEEFKEHPLMVSGIKIQQLVGARNAWAVDVAQRCCTAIAGLKLAKGLMATDPAVRTVLLAGGYRNGDLIDYRNPRVSFMYSLGAAGGAVLLRRGHERNVLGRAVLRTDGDFADDVAVPAGGTVQPLTPELVGTGAAMLDVTDHEAMKARLAERSGPNFEAVIREAAGERGIDYLALLHMKRSAFDGLLGSFGLRPEQSTYLDDLGHLGQFDPIFSLERAEADGRLKPGMHAVLATAGVSYAWGAMGVAWG